MFDRADAAFATLLEQEIIKILSAGADPPGLHRTILSSKDFNEFLGTKGEIKAYENVLKVMADIFRRMNQQDETENRRGMN